MIKVLEIFFFNFQIDDSNVCQVRVDFVDTQLLEPSAGSCVKQYLTIKGITILTKKIKMAIFVIFENWNASCQLLFGQLQLILRHEKCHFKILNITHFLR